MAGFTTEEVSGRLERLPYSGWHTKTLVIVGTATFFDAFDSLTIAFVLPVLLGLWKLTPSEVGLLISAGFVGQLIGAVFFSWIAERVGRRRALSWSIWIVAIFSLATAFSWNYTSFLLFRVVQGLGLGGEVPVAAAYMNELVQSRIRGRLVILLQSTFAVGILACAAVATKVVPEFGWQSLYLLGAVPALLALFLRRLLPESPRWLADQGRVAEANATIEQIEEAVVKSTGRALPAPVALKNVEVASDRKSGLPELVSRTYRMRTAWLSLAMLCASLAGYGLLSWMPTIYRTVYKLPVQEALNVSLISYVSICLGGLCLALLVDRFGRRPCLTAGYVGTAAPLVALYFVSHTAPLSMVVTLVSVGLFFVSFLLTGGYLYAAEIYPTRLRAVGTGVASGWLRFGSIVGPTVVGALLTVSTINSVFLFFAIAAIVGALVVIVTFTETAGRVLE